MVKGPESQVQSTGAVALNRAAVLALGWKPEILEEKIDAFDLAWPCSSIVYIPEHQCDKRLSYRRDVRNHALYDIRITVA